MIPVTVERTTPTQLADNSSLEVLFALEERKILVTNTYNLSAVYCEPTTQPADSSHKRTVQMLVHGATFNKIMWDFPYKPERYSWVRRMISEGYATLVIKSEPGTAPYPMACWRLNAKPLSKLSTKSSACCAMVRLVERLLRM